MSSVWLHEPEPYPPPLELFHYQVRVAPTCQSASMLSVISCKVPSSIGRSRDSRASSENVLQIITHDITRSFKCLHNAQRVVIWSTQTKFLR